MTIVDIHLTNGNDNQDEWMEKYIDDYISEMCSELEKAGCHEITYRRQVMKI